MTSKKVKKIALEEGGRDKKMPIKIEKKYNYFGEVNIEDLCAELIQEFPSIGQFSLFSPVKLRIALQGCFIYYLYIHKRETEIAIHKRVKNKTHIYQMVSRIPMNIADRFTQFELVYQMLSSPIAALLGNREILEKFED